jgi:hydrogenase maturation protease
MTEGRTILVCGDAARGDDGAAIAAIARLAPVRRHGVRVRVVGQLEPDQLVEALLAGRCMVVDAVRGVAPGRIVEMPLRRIAERGDVQPASSHALQIEMVIGLAGALGADIDRGWFVGIGGGRFDLGASLSAAVEEALGAAAAAVDRRLRAWETQPCA